MAKSPKTSKISNETFVNPYNFISLQGECSRGKDYIEIKKSENPSELLTGWLECDMKTLTPIFIPNTSDSKSDIFEKRTIPDPKKPNEQPKPIKSYDFFSYTNLDGMKGESAPSLPVIPGSEIRGMIRSAFEALTNSCFSTIDKDRVLYKRTTSPATSCGILNFDDNTKKWVVWKCKKYGVAIRNTQGDGYDFSSIVNGLYDGQEVYIEITGRQYYSQKQNRNLFEVVEDIKTTKIQGYTKGWFHKGEKFGDTNRKHHESVFVLEYPVKFELGSILKWTGFIMSLKDPTTNDKKRIVDLLNDESKKIIKGWKNDDELTDEKNEKKKTLIKGLNELLNRNDFYKEEVFGAIKICEDAKKLLKKGLKDLPEEDLQKFNRLLLEAIYPHEIAKSQFFEVPNEAVECLLENLKLYNDEKINAHKKSGHHNGYEHIAKDLNKNVNELKTIDLHGLPVYYAIHKRYPVYYATHKGSNGEDYYYLSPAAIGREVFYNTLDKILENKGGYQPCTDRKKLCSACALFGTAEKDNAVASRVRFTDAVIPEEKKLSDNSQYFENVKIFPELASPKPSAVEFYLKRPLNNGNDKVAIWNYDYAVIWKNGNKNNKEEKDNYQPALRGRKFYWHKKINEALFLDPTNEKDKKKISDRNVAVRPLRKDIDFKFRVYFNNITEDELKNLIWTLEIGGNKNNAHKIGMGKPLGLGSVQIVVSDIKLRTVGISYQSVSYEIDSNQDIIKQVFEEKSIETLLGCEKKVLEEFCKITDYKNAPANVMYPCNERSDKTYEWFVSNKIVENTGGTGTNPFINKELPSINYPVLNKYK